MHAQCGVYNVHARGDNLVFVHLVSVIIQRPSHERYVHYMVAAVVYGYSLPPRSTFRSPTRGPSGNEGLNSFVLRPVSLTTVRKSKSVHCSTVSVKTRRNDSPQ